MRVAHRATIPPRALLGLDPLPCQFGLQGINRSQRQIAVENMPDTVSLLGDRCRGGVSSDLSRMLASATDSANSAQLLAERGATGLLLGLQSGRDAVLIKGSNNIVASIVSNATR